MRLSQRLSPAAPVCTELITKFRTCTTDIFWELEVQNRPATVPPHQINGGSAAAGGEHNNCNDEWPSDGEGTAAADGEYADEDDEDEAENRPPQRGAPHSRGHAAPDEQWRAFDDDTDELLRDEKTTKSTAKKAPKPLNIGGSAKTKQRPPARGGSAHSAAMMIAHMEKARQADIAREEAKEEAARKQRAEDREHDMNMLRMVLTHRERD